MKENHWKALGFSIIIFAIIFFFRILNMYPERDLQASILAITIVGLLTVLGMMTMDVENSNDS